MDAFEGNLRGDPAQTGGVAGLGEPGRQEILVGADHGEERLRVIRRLVFVGVLEREGDLLEELFEVGAHGHVHSIDIEVYGLSKDEVRKALPGT